VYKLLILLALSLYISKQCTQQRSDTKQAQHDDVTPVELTAQESIIYVCHKPSLFLTAQQMYHYHGCLLWLPKRLIT